MKEYVAMVSSKGQIVIAKAIRDELGIQQNQPLKESVEDGRIILEPMPTLVELGGTLKLRTKKTVDQLMREADEGWD